MAIKIDLLPGYVGLRRWFKRILAICVALVGVFAAVLFLLYYREQLQLDKLEEDKQNIEKFAKMTDDADAKMKKAQSDSAARKTVVGFIVDASRTGPERAAVLDMLHRYVYRGAVIRTLDISDGQTAKFTGTVETPDDYARFILNLRRGTAPVGPAFADLPKGSGVRGYPATGGEEGQAEGGGQQENEAELAGNNLTVRKFPISVNAEAKLREQIVVPIEPGGTAAPALGADGQPPVPPA